MVSKDEYKTMEEETLANKVKQITDNKELWCPHCAKFTPYKDLAFYGKNEKGENISSFHFEEIFEYQGYIYTCSKCGKIIDGMTIENIEL